MELLIFLLIGFTVLVIFVSHALSHKSDLPEIGDVISRIEEKIADVKAEGGTRLSVMISTQERINRVIDYFFEKGYRVSMNNNKVTISWE